MTNALLCANYGTKQRIIHPLHSMNQRSSYTYFWLLIGCLLLNIKVATAQITVPTQETIEQEIAILSERPDANTNTTLKSWKDLLSTQTNLQSIESKIAELTQNIENQPAELAAARQKLVTLSTQPAREVDLSLNLVESQKIFAAANLELENVKTELASLTEKAQQRDNRNSEIPDLIAEKSAQIIQLEENSQSNSDISKTSSIDAYVLSAEKALSTVTLEMLQIEQTLIQDSEQTEIAKKQILNKRIQNLSAFMDKLQPVIAQKSTAATEATQEKAKNLIERYKKIPQLRKYIQETAQYSALKNNLIKELSQLQNYENNISSQLQKTESQYTSAKNRIQLIESSNLRIDTDTSSLLRLQRKKLQTPKQLNQRLQQNIERSTTLQLDQIKLSDKLEELPIDKISTAQTIIIQHPELREQQPEIIQILKDHRSAIQAVYNHYDSVISSLQEANNTTRQAIDKVNTYSRYLDERLLWIASAPLIKFSDIELERKALDQLFSNDLPEWYQNILQDIREKPVIWIVFILLLATLIVRRKRYWQVLKLTATETQKKSYTKISPMWRALWVTFLLVLPFSLTAGFLSWRGDTPYSVSHGLRFLAFFFAFTGSLRTLTHPDGVLAAHLHMEEPKRALLKKHVTWMMYVMPLFLFLSTALIGGAYSPGAGRIIFILLMLIAIAFAHLVLLPSKGLFQRGESNPLIPRLLYAIGIGLPSLFLIGSCMGYMSSVQTIRLQVIGTIIVILTSIFLSKLCLRTVLLSRRRLAKEQAKEQYKAKIVARKAEADPDNPDAEQSDDHIKTLEELEADAANIVSVEEQTKRMVRLIMVLIIIFSTWSIWSSSLLALSKLDDIKLGQQNAPTSQQAAPTNIDFSSTLTGGIASSETDDTAQPIVSGTLDNTDQRLSLKDILKAILLACITFAIARNLPGLLDLLILRRLKMQASITYAVTTLVRYVIVFVGILMIFNALGITWSSVQWLAAAITLGIGFGLQEIFANFVAGIILLFERPIRLGDIVTVGDYSGQITQINIRATTINQFNNREVVVPNKDFITNQLVNWTLKDSVLRYEFIVGVAYGSDTKLAAKILNEIMDNHPRVLKQPSTDVTFMAFGASTLDFRVRGYVRNPKDLVEVPSELHFEIDERFREADIEIAFPQTDIHIRSLPDNFTFQNAAHQQVTAEKNDA